jgi:hypothetical protein
VLDVTISVTSTYQLSMPVWSGVSVGALHGNVISLGARVTTIAATTPPVNVTAIRPTGGSQITLTFNAPQPALTTPLSLTYAINSVPIATVAPSGTVTPGTVIGCYSDGTSQTIYMTASQPNGLESARIPIAVVTPQPLQMPQC